MKPHNLERYRAAEKRLWDHYHVRPVEHFVQLPKFGIKVRVLEIGEGDPVLFVHGNPNAGPKWTPLAARLSDFRCLVLDRPGCGLSEPVDYQSIDLREFGAELIDQVLDGLELPRADLVASSIGGALAFYFSHAHPERVIHLVQEGCPAFIPGFHVPFYNVVSSALNMAFGWSPPSREGFRHLGHASQIDRKRFEMEVLTWRDALLKYTDTARNENGLNMNVTARSSQYACDKDFLGEIKTPTLYLWGIDDPFGGAYTAVFCANYQPNALLYTFPGSGHLPWLDDAQAHANLVRTFLRGGEMPPSERTFYID